MYYLNCFAGWKEMEYLGTQYLRPIQKFQG